MWNSIKHDYRVKYKKKCSIFIFIKTYFLDYNFRVVVRYRIQSKCMTKNKIFKFIAILIKNGNIKKYGVEIGLNAKISNGFHIAHLNGIVVGDKAIIGENFTIYQQVTIGQKDGLYPVIKDNVILYPGSKVIGDIVIGSGAKIGANALVLKNVGFEQSSLGYIAKNYDIRKG